MKRDRKNYLREFRLLEEAFLLFCMPKVSVHKRLAEQRVYIQAIVSLEGCSRSVLPRQYSVLSAHYRVDPITTGQNALT